MDVNREEVFGSDEVLDGHGNFISRETSATRQAPYKRYSQPYTDQLLVVWKLIWTLVLEAASRAISRPNNICFTTFHEHKANTNTIPTSI